MKKYSSFLLAIVLVLTMFSGCGATSSSTPQSQGTTGESAAQGSGTPKENLIVGVQIDIDTLDQQNSTQAVINRLQGVIYETLVTWTKEEGYQPSLAESYEWDGTDLVFHLRKGVLFHNGDEMKASDVKYSIERVMAIPRHETRYNMIQDIVCEDDYTVRIVCEEVSDKLLVNLTRVQYGAGIISEKFTTEAGDNTSTTECGTGPYKLQSWTTGDSLVVERFDDYWGEQPPSKTITYRVMSEDTSRIIALETGEIDICETLPVTDVARVSGTDGLTVLEKESVAITYWGFNLQKEGSPFTNQKVREAMNYAIDREAVMAAVGGSTALYTVFSPPMEGYDETIGTQFAYDPDKARQLLEEAGYPDGFTVDLYVKSSDSYTKAAATVINAYAAQVGVTVDIITLEGTAMMAELSDGKHDSYILTASNVDPYTGFIFFYSGTTASGGNRMFYSNPEMDELYEKLPSISDSAQRQEMLRRMQEIAVADCAWVPLYGQSFYVGAKSSVTGVGLDPVGFHCYAYATVTE